MSSDDYAGEDFLGEDFLGEDFLGDDYAGDDYAGEDILGAQYRRQRARRRGRRGGRMTQRVALGRPINHAPPWRMPQAAPGVMLPTEQLLPLGFLPEGGSFSFVSGGPTTLTFVAQPQKPFRGERLIIDVAKTSGAVGNTVNVNILAVGTDLQIVSAAPFPAVAFSPTAFGVRLALTAAQPGIRISLGVELIGPALAPNESVTVVPTVLGRAIL